MSQIYDNVIVGAGISGLWLARSLQSHGARVLVIEKSKSVGGRMATRRGERPGLAFDHGAQFYKSRSNPSGGDQIHQSLQAVSHLWFSRIDFDYYAAVEGINRIPKFLSNSLNLVFNQKIVSLMKNKNQEFQIVSESGQQIYSRNVILSCPLPQSLELLKKSQIEYDHQLNEIQYASAIVGLFELQDHWVPLKSDFDYLDSVDENIFSISHQKSKKTSLWPALTVTMSNSWSSNWFSESDDKILIEMKKILIDLNRKKDHFLNLELEQIKSLQIKKWKYSHPLSLNQQLFHQVESSPGLILIGDAFGGASVTGAIRSAQACADHLIQSLN